MRCEVMCYRYVQQSSMNFGSAYKNDCGGANKKNGKSTQNDKITTITRRVDVGIAFSRMVFSIYAPCMCAIELWIVYRL